MNFNVLIRVGIAVLLLLPGACGDAAREQNLVDLFATANQNVVEIDFAADAATTVSINSQTAFSVQGLVTPGTAPITVSDGVHWSLSAGALSSIDQRGLLRAAPSAETFTLTAELGILRASRDIRVSDADFDRVDQLDQNGLTTLDVCQSRVIQPLGIYIDDQDNAEPARAVDSTVINSIEWIVRDAGAAVDTRSSRAFIDTLDNVTRLHALAPGAVEIQARALSIADGSEKLSEPFEVTVGALPQALRICLAGEQDLASCSVASANVQASQVLSFIGIATYLAGDGSQSVENITRNGKWGISQSNVSLSFSGDREQMNVSGQTAQSSVSVSLACGDIQELLTGIDISQGIRLDSAVSCASGTTCISELVNVTIERPDVLSLAVTANGVSLTDNTVHTLTDPLNELTLVVTANYSNATDEIVTSDGDLSYSFNEQLGVIERVSGNRGVFTVLNPGTIEIQLEFGNQTFTAIIQIP